MLVLTRGYEKSLQIGADIEIKVVGFMMMNDAGKWEKVKPTYPIQVQLGIEAPRSIQIMRSEALEKSTQSVDKMVEDRDNLCAPSYTEWRLPEQRDGPQPRENKKPRRERKRRQRSHR